MREIYPEYRDRVTMLAVGVDPSETADVLREYQAANDYPWCAAVNDYETLVAYNVLTTATKVGVDRHGVVAFRAGFGVLPADEWRQAFEDLVAR